MNLCISRPRWSVSCACALALSAGSAAGQTEVVAWTADNQDEMAFFATDAGVGVNGHAIVATGNMNVALLNKAGTVLDSRKVSDANWPFFLIDEFEGTGSLDFPSRFFDPQVEYHTQSGRLWMLYSETNSQRIGGGGVQSFGTGANDLSALHIAISKPMVSPNTLDSFDTTDWWYFTGDGSTHVGQAGDFFNLQDGNIQRYRQNIDDDIHLPYPTGGGTTTDSGKVDKPQFAVDEQAMYVASLSGNGSTLLIVPTSHGPGGTLSILDGEKPPADTWTMMRFRDLGEPGFDGAEDGHEYHYAVQEPIEDERFENVQFIISLPGGGPNDDLRLGAIWFDAAAGQWQYTQRRNSPLVLDDPDVGAGFTYYRRAKFWHNPSTPDPGGWRPDVRLGILNGVLAFDTNDNPRIFAVHHMGPPSDSTEPDVAARFAVQWYVIDPDLDNVYDTTPGQWQPTVVARGRLDGAGDRYHPAIGLTPAGVAYVEYTYSSSTVWPEVRRVELNSGYTGIVGSEVVIQSGVATAYADSESQWADFNEMQLDPAGCRLWSVDTLVHADTSGNPPPPTTTKRDVWLFENRFTPFCFTPDMNGNGMLESHDAMLYNDYYAQQDERADADANGDVNVSDMAVFLDAFTAGVP